MSHTCIELCQSASPPAARSAQNMRESREEAPVYLAVMSADPHVVPMIGNPPTTTSQALPGGSPSPPRDGEGGNTTEKTKKTTATTTTTTTAATVTTTPAATGTGHTGNNSVGVESENEEEPPANQVSQPTSGGGKGSSSGGLALHLKTSTTTTTAAAVSAGAVMLTEPGGGSSSENTKSAFEIISVSAFDTAEDLEQSKGMSHEADSFMEDPAKTRGQSESSESDEILRASLGGAGGRGGRGGKEMVEGYDTDTMQPPREHVVHIIDTNERGLPLEGGASANGPVLSQPVPRRFRRVNKYERGRWVIEDTLEHREAEERPESEMRGSYVIQGSSSRGGVAVGMVGAGPGRESPYSQRRKPGEGGGGGATGGEDPAQLHSRSSSDVGGGLGLDSPNTTGERDINYHSERGEVTSTISRNTSMSSLTTAGDHSNDRMSQLKDESESEITCPSHHTPVGGNSSQGATISPPQHPRHGEALAVTATTTTTPATSDSGGEDSQ